MTVAGDWIIENCSTVGTGPLVLTGSLTGFGSFASIAADTDLVFYSIEAANGDKEAGIGTYNSAGNSIARTNIYTTIKSGVYDKTAPTAITLNGGAIVGCTATSETFVGTEFTIYKGVANGYASLDANTLVPLSQIPLITYAKIQNAVANNVILGNNTGVNSSFEELDAAAVRLIINVEDGATADQTAGEIEAIISHDNLISYAAAQHIDWSLTNAANIHADNYTNTTYVSGDWDHNLLTNYVVDQHINWTAASAGTIDPTNYKPTWVAKTAAYTAIDGDYLLADTLTTAAFTITLPLAPSAGARVIIMDSASNFTTANLTLGRNSENISGVAADSVQATDDVYLELVYVNSSYGWRIL